MKKRIKKEVEETEFESETDDIESSISDIKKDSEEETAEITEFADDKAKKKVPFFKFDNSAYMSYERKVIIYLILVLGCAILSTIFLTRSFSTGKQEHISDKQGEHEPHERRRKRTYGVYLPGAHREDREREGAASSR